jgi:hypothetical protein
VLASPFIQGFTGAIFSIWVDNLYLRVSRSPDAPEDDFFYLLTLFQSQRMWTTNMTMQMDGKLGGAHYVMVNSQLAAVGAIQAAWSGAKVHVMGCAANAHFNAVPDGVVVLAGRTRFHTSQGTCVESYGVHMCAGSRLLDMNTPGFGAAVGVSNSSSASLTNCAAVRGFGGDFGGAMTGRYADDDSALRLENTTFQYAVRASVSAGLAHAITVLRLRTLRSAQGVHI